MITIKRTFCPGRGMIRPEELTGYVFSPEAAAHMFIITKMEKVDGQEAAVPFDAGTDISCRFIKANGVTELVDGDLTDDGAASITLPAECYQVPGRFILSIYAETSEETICIYSATATALAVTKNIAPQTVTKVMRWSTARMLDRYAHPDTNDALAAVNAMQK